MAYQTISEPTNEVVLRLSARLGIQPEEIIQKSIHLLNDIFNYGEDGYSTILARNPRTTKERIITKV